MNIVIIGTGNTATVLGRLLKKSGHRIVQVYGRNAVAASELAYKLDTESTNYWSVVNREADIYIIAVSDIAMEEVLHELQLPQKTIVHTAASVSKDIFKPDFRHYGVFYPLQSLKKETAHLPDTPIIIDASDTQTLELLTALAESISDIVVTADDEQRLKLHLAAVLCNNFVNHLYVLVEDYCKMEGIDFRLLVPLIKETAERVATNPASKLQTGPALRKDTQTINKHLALLENYPRIKQFYELFTSSITERG